jgi:hypothetical protein
MPAVASAKLVTVEALGTRTTGSALFVLPVQSDRSAIRDEGQLRVDPVREILLEPISVIMGGDSRRYEVTGALP